MPEDEESGRGPHMSETITHPAIRRRAVGALRAAEAWKEALLRGDILEAEAQFEKLKHLWNFITSDYAAEQRGEVARQYTCSRCGAIYSQREHDSIEMIVCAPSDKGARNHQKSDLVRVSLQGGR